MFSTPLNRCLSCRRWVSEGGVIFVHCAGWSRRTMQRVKKLADGMPIGSLCIMVNESLTSESWGLIGADRGIQTSWGPATLNCFEKIS
jgi:hypothetical protein